MLIETVEAGKTLETAVLIEIVETGVHGNEDRGDTGNSGDSNVD